MAYVTADEIRELAGMDDDDKFPDETIADAIADAEYRIDRECGTSFEPKPFSVTVCGDGSASVVLKTREGRRVMYPRTPLVITVDGEAFADAVTLDNIGSVTRVSGRFAKGAVVVVTGEAGVTDTVPEDIRLAAKMLARQTVRDGIPGLSDRTIQRSGEFGTERIAQPGMKYPTGIPLVDRILGDNNHLPPVVV